MRREALQHYSDLVSVILSEAKNLGLMSCRWYYGNKPEMFRFAQQDRQESLSIGGSIAASADQ